MDPTCQSQLDDARRLAALADTGLLDSPPEEAFDRIARLAGRVLGAPVALVSLVDRDRQFFKSAVGLPEPWATCRQTPLSHSFCRHVVESGQPLLVGDARAHPGLRDNGAVADLSVVGYAGVPLVDRAGNALGALCVIDGRPREWTGEDESVLREFAALVMSAVETRASAAQQVRAAEALRDAEAKFKAFMDHSPAVTYLKDEDGRFLYTNETLDRYYPEAKGWLGRLHEEVFPPDVAAAFRANDRAAVASAGGVAFEEQVPNAAGERHHWMTFKFPVHQADGRVLLGGMSVNIDDRKRAELALRESEDRFRHLVAGVRDYAIFMLDPGGTVVTWNEGAERAKGYAEAEIVGRSFEAFYPPEDQAAGRPQAVLRAAERDGVARDEGWRVRRDGTRFYANVTVTALRCGEGRLRGFAKFTHDVTDRNRVAAAREAAERKVRAIYDSAFQFIGLLDTDGTLLDANETALRFAGRPLSAMAGLPFWECPWWTHSADAQAVCREAVRRAAAGETFRAQTTHVGPDGRTAEMDFTLKPLRDEAGRITHLIPEGRDITALHVARAELQAAHGQLREANDGLERRVRERTADLEAALGSLREGESALRFMADAMPQIVWTAKPDGNLDYYNRRWFEYTGLTFEQTKDWGWKPVLHPDDLQDCVDCWTRAYTTGQSYEVEYRFRRASDGAYRWHLGRAEPMRDADGRVVKWFGTCTDIDDHKRATDDLAAQVAARTAELAKATRAAEAASEAKSRFLAHMSHEIRTPLTAIFGYTDLLVLPGSDAADLRDCVQTIRRNGEHLLAIINDILDLSKIEAGQMTVERVPTNPALLLGELLPLLRQRASAKGITLDVHFATPVPETFGSDPTRLRQILLNLIGNAIKFTSRGGVVIHLRYEGTAAGGPAVSFAVQDTGIGMTPDQAGRMFAPFTQADTSHARQYGGTGLGLSISRRLAGLLGGDIALASEHGVGSVFTLTLPAPGTVGGRRVSAVTVVGAGPAAADAATAADRAFDGRILLAEDSPDSQRLISAHLRHAGATVEVVGNGRAAVDAATRAAAAGRPYDLILMDCQMPEMDGYTATRVLRQAGYDRPIVALTANAMSHDRDQCLAAGSDHFLTKPLDLGVFYRVVRSYLRAAPRAAAAAVQGEAVTAEGGRIVSELAGDPIVGPLVGPFVRNMRGQAESIRRAAASGDLASVSAMAHQLKGAAGSYGFPAITTAARSLERAAAAGPGDESFADSVNRLSDLCVRASEA